MEMSLAGLLMIVITLHGVNGQSSLAIGLCLTNGVNDISRVDATCGSQLDILLSNPNFFDLPQSTLDEVCSMSCWNRFSSVLQRCFTVTADSADLAELGFRLACGRQSDGDNCAQVFDDLSDDMNDSEGVCEITTPGQCPAGCTNFLMDNMQQLGCCFGESLFLFSLFDSTRQLHLDFMEIYRTCNMSFPQPCQDVSSPATTASTLTTASTRVTNSGPTQATSGRSAAVGGWAFNGIVMIVMVMMSLMV